MVYINASGIPPEVLLWALYVNSKVQGIGIIENLLSTPPTSLEDFSRAITTSSRGYIDYLNGKVIKTNFSNMASIDSFLYDRDNPVYERGQAVSKLEKIVKKLREAYPEPIAEPNTNTDKCVDESTETGTETHI